MKFAAAHQKGMLDKTQRTEGLEFIRFLYTALKGSVVLTSSHADTRLTI